MTGSVVGVLRSDTIPISPNNIVPSISAKNTCPPVKTSSSQELDPKARAAGQFRPNIIRRKIAPTIEPAICEKVYSAHRTNDTRPPMNSAKLTAQLMWPPESGPTNCAKHMMPKPNKHEQM